MKIKHTQLSRYLCPVLGCREFRYRGHRRFCPAHWVELPESVRGEIDRLGKAMKDCPDDYRAAQEYRYIVAIAIRLVKG